MNEKAGRENEDWSRSNKNYNGDRNDDGGVNENEKWRANVIRVEYNAPIERVP